MILTNYEYAKDPSKESATEKRTNAKNFRNSITRVDALIRTRNLTDAEVTEINFILKSRTNRFLGAAVEDWLFPERTVEKNWDNIGEVLLPPKNQLWHFGGEMYIGYEDGSSHFQDAFGRSQPENKYLRKAKANPKPEEPCGCGSAKVFKECCQNKPEALRPSWTHLSIRERNIIFTNGILEILGLNKDKTWLEVRKTLTDEQVQKIYELYGSLWMLDTDLISLLPKPDGKLRALYTGIIDPTITPYLVPAFIPYFGEIIIQSPFINPWGVNDEYNPIKSPHKFKRQILKHINLFLSLMPFITTGQINFIPDPCSFDFHLRKQMHMLAKERVGNVTLEGRDFRIMRKLAEDELKRTQWSLPEDIQRRQIKKALPHLTPKQIEDTIIFFRSQLEADPLALLQSDMLDVNKGGQFLISSLVPNFEICMFLAQATGAILVTDSEFRWNEMKGAQSLTMGAPHSDYQELLKFLENEPFLLCMDPIKSPEITANDQFNYIRIFFNNMVNSAQTSGSARQITLALKKDFKDAKSKADELLTGDHSISTHIECLMPNGGLVHNNTQRLLLMSGVQNYTKNVPLAVYVDSSFDIRR